MYGIRGDEGNGNEIILSVIEGHEHELIDDQKVYDNKTPNYLAFQQAFKALEGIVYSTRDWWKKNEPENNADISLYGYANNIIGFFAKRGQGKTSAMLSFSNALKHLDKNDYKQIRKDFSPLGECNFIVFPPIDPTLFNANDSVVSIILSCLVEKIKSKWDTGDYCPADNKRNRQEYGMLLENITKCQNGIRLRNREIGKQGYEDLEQGVNGLNVKNLLNKIIHQYSLFCGRDRKTDFYVIQVDDTDMVLENAYGVLEDIRRYLSVPNVVVLMASYMKQLRQLIEAEYSDKLKIASHNFDSTTHMAAKYLDKIIPPSHQIFLPQVRELLGERTNVRIKRSEDDDRIKRSEGDGCNDKNESELPSIERYLFEAISEKTGIVFIKHISYTHQFIPGTLRGLSSLVRLLQDMPEVCPVKFPDRRVFENGSREEQRAALIDFYTSVKNRAQVKLENLSIFNDYFMNDWAVSRLDRGDAETKYRDLLKKLEHNSQNLRIRQCYKELITNYAEDSKKTSKGFGKAYDANYVDLLKLLDNREAEFVSDHEYAFSFSLKTFFTIQLNRAMLESVIESTGYLLENADKKEGQALFEKSPFAFAKMSKLFYETKDANDSGNATKDPYKWLIKQERLLRDPDSYVRPLDKDSSIFNKSIAPEIFYRYVLGCYMVARTYASICCNADVQHVLIASYKELYPKNDKDNIEEENGDSTAEKEQKSPESAAPIVEDDKIYEKFYKHCKDRDAEYLITAELDHYLNPVRGLSKREMDN